MARTSKAIAHAVSTVIEQLEPRRLLSNTLISGPASILSSSPYTLNLNTPQQGSGVSWNVNWGDGNTTSSISGNTLTASHPYAAGVTSAGITATLSSMPKPLDTSFGAGGKVVTDMGSAADHAYDVQIVRDSDPINGGKIVVAGGSGFSIARYNPDGSLDTTFGSGGKVAIGGTSASYGLAIQPDGKYVVGGGENFAMARFNADGSLDTTFGTNGIASSGFGTTYLSYDLSLLPTGKIVQVGRNGSDIVIARFNANGSVDTSFGSGGKRTTDFAGSLDKGFGLAVDNTGRLVVVGQERNGATNYDWAIARYTADGTLDNSFGSSGKVTTNFGSDDDLAWAVDIQSDNKIVVGGRTKNANDYDFALARYNTDGSLDSSFGSGGKQTTDFGSGGDQIYALKVLSDGRIAAVGWSQSSSNAMDFGVALYQSSGQLDTSFASGGKYRQDFAGSTDDGEAIAVQSDGDLVIAGSASTVGSNGASDFAVTRLHMGNTGVFVAGDTGTPGGSFQTSFKFGVDNSAAVPGYITEIGNEYEDNLWSSGYDYGWVDQATGASTKNSAGEIGDVHASPALKNSAVRSFKDGTPLAWQIKVPNGSYYVKLVAGDPTVSSGTYKYGVEGNANFLSGTGQFVTATGIVTVTDGKLTVFNGSGATTGNALSYIEITDASARNRSTVTAPTGAAATATGVVNTSNNTTGVDVRWEDKSDNETGFKIERATDPSGTWTPLGTANANAGVFTDLTASFNTTYYYRLSAVKGSVASATTTPVSVTTPASGAQTVYGNGGLAWNTDTPIQAEDFDAGGAGVADSDVYDGNAGGYYRASNTDIGHNLTDGKYFIGWTRVGEWIEYTMNVQTPGTYRLDLSAASQGQGGTFSITTAGSSTELSRVVIPNTTSFRTYQSVSSGTFTLPQGVTVLRLTAIDDGISPYWLGDMDSIKLASVSAPVNGSITGNVSIAAGTQPNSPPSSGPDFKYFTTVRNTDFVSTDFGGMRDSGNGQLQLSGVSGQVSHAYLYWHGPTDSDDPTANAAVKFNGHDVVGQNIGFSADNAWDYANSQSYRADVTGLVAGNGTYSLANFTKSDANVNGASLLVFFNDGNSANNRDVILFNGNDSNTENPYDADGWNVDLDGINYTSGDSDLELHVSDGQQGGTYADGAMVVNNETFAPDGDIFNGDSVPFNPGYGPGGVYSGSLWDKKAFDLSDVLHSGSNDLQLRSNQIADCLSLVVAAVNLPAGSAPTIPSWTVYLDQNQNGRLDSGECSTPVDADGNYQFTNLAAGTYHVAEAAEAGWDVISPAPDPEWTVTIASGDNVTGKNFVNKQHGQPSSPLMITSQTSASATTVSETTVNLQVGVSTGQGPHSYVWHVTSPQGVSDPTFSPANASKTTVTFSQTGTYTFYAVITDGTTTLTSNPITISVVTTSHVTVSPATVTLAEGESQHFDASVTDQFGNILETPVTWSSSDNEIDADGLYTAPQTGDSVTVTATAGNATPGTAEITLTHDGNTGGPSINYLTASAISNDGKSMTLTAAVTAAANATHTWFVSPDDAGVQITDVNTGTPGMLEATVTFSKVGNYTFSLRLHDDNGSVSKSTQTISVAPIVGSFAVTPANVEVPLSTAGLPSTKEFAANAVDQFGQPVDVQWSCSGGGTIDQNSGLYTAPISGTSATIVASANGVTGTAAHVILTSLSNPEPVTGLQAYTASATQINLHWQPSTVSNVTYNVYRSSSSDFVADDATFVGSVASGGVPAFADTWVPAAGLYYYKVITSNGVSESSPSVASTDSSIVPSPPAPITNLHAQFDPNANEGMGAVVLTWNTTSTNETDFVFTRLNEDGSTTVLNAPANATQLVDAGPFPETATQSTTGPTYEGNAENAGGKSADSAKSGAPPLPGSATGKDDNPIWRDGNFDNNGDGKDDNEGGVDDGDGNQILTDRDDYWATHHGSTLFIGFAGHLQSEGFDTNHGRVWDVSPASGIYAMGQELLTKKHQNVTLFPEDPGNASATNRDLDGDGVIGVPNPAKGNARVDAQGNADGALAFLIDAIKNHGIRNVGLFGYSYGGGAINILLQTLGIKAANDPQLAQLLSPQLPTRPHVDFFSSAFIDAVKINLTNSDPSNFDTTGSIEVSNTAVPVGNPGNAGGAFKVDRLFNIYQSKRNIALDSAVPPDPLEPRGAEISQADWTNAGGANGKLTNIDTDGDGPDVQKTATHGVLDWGARGLDHIQAHGFGIAENNAAGDPKYGGVENLVIDDLLAGLNDAQGH